MSRSGPVGVGLIGAGMISDTYLENLTSFRDVRVLIVGDLDRDRARTQSAKYQVPESGGADDVLSHADVELVVNLTIPAVHAQVSSEAVAAGKHVWSEKPISIDRESGRASWRPPTTPACSSAWLRTRCSAKASRPPESGPAPGPFVGRVGAPRPSTAATAAPRLPHASGGFDRFSRSGGVNLGGRYWV